VPVGVAAPVPVGVDAPVPVGAATSLPGAARPMPLVRANERRVLRLDAGVTWECLAEPSTGAVDFLLVTYAPGAASSSAGELMCHAGFEYGFLQCGRLTLTLGSEEIHLGAGDAVSFASSTPHAYRNDGTEPAVGVWFVDEPCPRGVDRPE
jgi:Cupin domain